MTEALFGSILCFRLQCVLQINGKRVVVIGRSRIVGTPVAELLKWHNATVTLCHSKTEDLSFITKQADILVVAVGKAEVRAYLLHVLCNIMLQ